MDIVGRASGVTLKLDKVKAISGRIEHSAKVLVRVVVLGSTSILSQGTNLRYLGYLLLGPEGGNK